jgi:SAM-dependent methyltransferase
MSIRSTRKGRADRTIEDFGDQWTSYRKSEGYVGSLELLADFVAPVALSEFEGRRVMDLGAGNGRFSFAALQAGAREVVAVEPSRAADVIRGHARERGKSGIKVLQVTGDKLPQTGDFDLVMSLGVIHHIPEPAPVICAAYGALRPGGKLVIWLYGHEGNEWYLFFAQPLRALTKRMPHWALVALTYVLDIPLLAYAKLCRFYSGLPMSRYAGNIIAKLDAAARRVVIYDQLNPDYAKYYRRTEVATLMSAAPFEQVVIRHRHGYSWTAVGTRAR